MGNAINNVFLTLYANGNAISTKTLNSSTSTPTAQVDTITVAGTVRVNDVVTTTLGGTAFKYTSTGTTATVAAA